jgi:hypothetical protein
MEDLITHIAFLLYFTPFWHNTLTQYCFFLFTVIQIRVLEDAGIESANSPEPEFVNF